MSSVLTDADSPMNGQTWQGCVDYLMGRIERLEARIRELEATS